MDPHVLKPPNLVQLAPSIPQVSTLCPANTPAKHMGDSDSLQTAGPKKLLDPSQGTWKRLGPPKQVLDIKSTSLTGNGPKRKTEDVTILHDTTLDKKQKLDEEAKVLQKIMANNMGSAVAAWQHHQVQ